jgi:hypothetical protein
MVYNASIKIEEKVLKCIINQVKRGLAYEIKYTRNINRASN